METREVYVGNGVTLNVANGSRKRFDYNKLNKAINSGVEVRAGMEEDWFFTGTDISDQDFPSNKEFEEALKAGDDLSEFKIAGICGSDWATPVMLINNEFIECWVYEN